VNATRVVAAGKRCSYRQSPGAWSRTSRNDPHTDNTTCCRHSLTARGQKLLLLLLGLSYARIAADLVGSETSDSSQASHALTGPGSPTASRLGSSPTKEDFSDQAIRLTLPNRTPRLGPLALKP